MTETDQRPLHETKDGRTSSRRVKVTGLASLINLAITLSGIAAILGSSGAWNLWRVLFGLSFFVLLPLAALSLLGSLIMHEPGTEAGSFWLRPEIRRSRFQTLIGWAFLVLNVPMACGLAWVGHPVWATLWIIDELVGRAFVAIRAEAERRQLRWERQVDRDLERLEELFQ